MALCECAPKAPPRPPAPLPPTPTEAWQNARNDAQRAAQRAPLAWGRVDAAFRAAFRTDAIDKFNAATATLTKPEMQAAATLVSALAHSAVVLNQLLTGAATESEAHVKWRAEIAAVARRVAAVDGQSAAETDAERLRERITNIRRSAPIAQQTMVVALVVPDEPGPDRVFRNQLEATRLFFQS